MSNDIGDQVLMDFTMYSNLPLEITMPKGTLEQTARSIYDEVPWNLYSP